MLEGAALGESLSGSGPSQMSLSQGKDFGQYHAAQHGGVADYGRAFDIMSDPNLLASSHSDNQLKALAEVRGLQDAQPTPLAPTIAAPGVVNGGPTGSCGTMQGGRRRRRVSRRKGRKGRKGRKSQKQQKQQQQGGRKRRYRRQGGGYAPVNAPGLLLDSREDYTRAGLNPEFFQSSSTEQLVADMRDSV